MLLSHKIQEMGCEHLLLAEEMLKKLRNKFKVNTKFKLPEQANQFIKKDSKIELFIEPYWERPDVRKNAIYIAGNQPGLRAFADLILMQMYGELEYEIHLDKFPFVTSRLDKPLILYLDYEIPYHTGNASGSVIETDEAYLWVMSEFGEAELAFTQFHGFQYLAWNHLHYDPTYKEADLAVYAYIEDEFPVQEQKKRV